jgi:hypothetical protein
MLIKSKLLTLVATSALAVAAYTGSAVAVTAEIDDLQADPCGQNPDLPQCQPDDDGDGHDFVPDLDFCFSIEPEEDCVPSQDPGPGEDGGDDGGVPTADPADPVAGTPNFTG